MGKKLSKLATILIPINFIISFRTNAKISTIKEAILGTKDLVTNALDGVKFVYSSGIVCDRYDVETFIGVSNEGLEKMTNSSEAFCGIKSVEGFALNDLFCGCISKVGLKADLINDNTVSKETIVNENNYIKKNFFNRKTLLASIWGAWNIWNAYKVINTIFNYISNINILSNPENFDIDLSGTF